MSVLATERGRVVQVNETVALNQSMEKVREGASRITCTQIMAMILAVGFFWGMITTALCATDDCYRKESLNCQVGVAYSCDNVKYLSIACMVISSLVGIIMCAVSSNKG